MLTVKRLPCLLSCLGCFGPVEADHAGRRGLSQKAPDDTVIPLCRKHHRERTDLRGYFKDWSAISMREWCENAIRQTREVVATLVHSVP